jgi:hypothetical protein
VREGEEYRPRRTNGYGGWGGLRFTLNVTNDSNPFAHVQPGIIVSSKTSLTDYLRSCVYLMHFMYLFGAAFLGVKGARLEADRLSLHSAEVRK